MLKLLKKLKGSKKKKNFDLLPNEIVTKIFSNLTPKQLATTSKTCKRFQDIAKNPSLGLSSIQDAFFKEKNDYPDHQMKRIFHSLNTKTFSDKEYKEITNLFKQGAQVKSDYLCIALYLYYQNKHTSNSKETKLYQNLIILLVDNGADLNKKYNSNDFRFLESFKGKTALQYANQKSTDDPGMAELLNQYNKFNTKQVSVKN